ncbi:hypothetical protein M0805_008550 [Coniferiporia weirii]|nr:hypothetical protein M0805_008550 [Coniferiporia weirii]
MASVLLTRRELTLLLFALTVFLVAYNFESTVRPLASVPSAASSFSARALLALRDQKVFREDGRRAPQFADTLEEEILGDWDIEGKAVHDLGPIGLTEDQQHGEWKNGDIPVTQLVAHVPGFTILENVILSEGTLYLVNDHAAQVFPKQEAMISTGLDSSYPPVLQDLKFLTRRQALGAIGYSAHRLSGTTVLCVDQPSLVDNQTLLALHRAYATLSEPSTPFLAPARTVLANTKREVLNMTGYELKLARAAFPYMVHLFAEDWDDLERSGRPALFERILLADRTAAELSAHAFDFAADVVAPREPSGDDDSAQKKKDNKNRKAGTTIEATDKRLAFAPAFALPARLDWAEPLRVGALSLPASPGAAQRRAVTYVSTQMRRGAGAGARLREDDHVILVRELQKLGAAQGWDIHVVELGGSNPTTWVDHVRAAAQSSVMLGVYGNALTNSVLLRPGPPGPKPAVVEFFPDGKFTNEHEFIARTLGIEYIAWRNTKKYSRGSLPPISPPTNADSKVLSIDVSAVVQFVKEQMRRS